MVRQDYPDYIGIRVPVTKRRALAVVVDFHIRGDST